MSADLEALDAAPPRPGAARGDHVRGGIGGLRTAILLAPMAVVLLVAFVYPLVGMLGGSFGDHGWTLEHYRRVFEKQIYLTVIFRTLRVSAMVALLCVLLGYPVAIYLSRIRGWLLAFATAVVLLPLWTNILVRTYAWTVILQRNGILNDLLQAVGLTDRPLTLLYTEPAMMAAMTQILLPFVILPIYASLHNIPQELYRAARNMGAGPGRIYLSVTLPLSAHGAASGATLVFVMALGFYVTPALIGGPRSMTIGPLIYQQVIELANWQFGAALAVVLLAVTLVVLAVVYRTVGLGRQAV